MLKLLLTMIISASVLSTICTAQPVVDFERDIQPIFKAHCTSCHGPKQQKNGFRLDRRKDAFRGGIANQIAPGNSEASHFYFRLIGDRDGLQMPPEKPLSAEHIKLIKAWIDQGAVWPDKVSGETPGTPAYMCPEQAAGEAAVDARGDIYSLGAVAFFALTGRPPFEGKSTGQLLAAHLLEPPPSLIDLRPDIPDALSAGIARCLAKQPAERFQPVAELDVVLARCLYANEWSANMAS